MGIKVRISFKNNLWSEHSNKMYCCGPTSEIKHLNLEFCLCNQLDITSLGTRWVFFTKYFPWPLSTNHPSARTNAAQQTVQIKKTFARENEHILLAQIYSTHFWEGSKFLCMRLFFTASFCPKWSIIWQWIRSRGLSGLQCLFTCIPQ